MWRTVNSWIGYPIVLVVVMFLAAIPAALTRNSENKADPNLDRFSITSFTADYLLEPQRDGTTDVLVTEEIVADFRRHGVNRGIVRVIPLRYQDHHNTLAEVSVTGEVEYSGRLRNPEENVRSGEQPFTTVTEGDDLIIRIGDSTKRLARGTQRWTIRYRLGDVAMNSPDRAKQEIYLNANGTGWSVPFDRVEARLHVPAELVERLDGTSACYRGPEGARERCRISATAPGHSDESVEPGVTVFTAAARQLDRREGMTFAVGFLPDTFPVAYTPRPDTLPWWLLVVPAIGVLIYLPPLIRYLRNSWVGRPRVLVTEYLPPEEVPALAAADIMGKPAKGPTAQLLELVVAGVLHLKGDDRAANHPAGPPGRLGRRQARRLRQSLSIHSGDFDQIPDEEIRGLMQGWFGGYWFGHRPERSTAADLVGRQNMLMVRRGWREWGPEPFGGFLAWYALILVVSAILMLAVRPTGPVFWLLIASGVVGVLLLVAAVYRQPAFGRLTESGRRIRDHLRGLEQFITMAEADRIAWLQGVESAPRITTEDHETLVKLYEPLLPYAVIFGTEKSWTAVLGEHRAAADLPPVAAGIASWGITPGDLVRVLDHGAPHRGVRRFSGDQTISSVNRSVHAFGESLSALGRSDNDGSGSSRRSSSSGFSSGSSWSSGGSSGGGWSGGGMGGGGGRGW